MAIEDYKALLGPRNFALQANGGLYIPDPLSDSNNVSIRTLKFKEIQDIFRVGCEQVYYSCCCSHHYSRAANKVYTSAAADLKHLNQQIFQLYKNEPQAQMVVAHQYINDHLSKNIQSSQLENPVFAANSQNSQGLPGQCSDEIESAFRPESLIHSCCESLLAKIIYSYGQQAEVARLPN